MNGSKQNMPLTKDFLEVNGQNQASMQSAKDLKTWSTVNGQRASKYIISRASNVQVSTKSTKTLDCQAKMEVKAITLEVLGRASLEESLHCFQMFRTTQVFQNLEWLKFKSTMRSVFKVTIIMLNKIL